MSEIKVSVIVPVYNVEKYLEECVDSLIGQTLKEIEILLIDDGSTDSSGDICDRYAQQYANIRVIHKANGGLGDARNVGASDAIGKYIYFIDSDDYLELEALEFLYKEAECKQLDVIMFSAESFSDDLDISFNPDDYRRTRFLFEVKSGNELFCDLFSVKEYYASIPLRFYNRDFFKKNNYKFPDIIHEDELLGFFSLIEADKAECIDNRFYRRRFRKGSIMTSEKAYKSAMGYVYTWNELVTFLKKTVSEYKVIYWNFSQRYLKLIINIYYKSFEDDEKIAFEVVRKNIKQLSKFNSKNLERSIRLFLSNPVIYGYYRKLRRKK